MALRPAARRLDDLRAKVRGVNLLLHLSVGAAAGNGRSGLTGFAAGVTSHAALDLIRHEDPPRRQRRVKLDALLTVAALAALGQRYGWRSGTVLGGLGGILPDGEHLLHRQLGRRYRHKFPTHVNRARFHSLTPTPPLSETAQTLLGLVVALALLLWP